MALIISATNRPNSNTLKVARYYQEELHQKGLDAPILDLQDIPGNILDTDLYGKRSAAFL
ncbi:MAG: NADPH-dependent FMN reductase, partial [Sphingobacteriales bacterium]